MDGENQKTIEKLQKELEVLRKVGKAILNIQNLNEVLDTILLSVQEILGFDFATISLVNAEKGIIETVAGVSVNSKWIRMAKHPLGEQDIQCYVVRTRETIVITPLNETSYDVYNVHSKKRWTNTVKKGSSASSEYFTLDKSIWDEFKHWELIRIWTPIAIKDKVIGTVEAGYIKKNKSTIGDPEIFSLEAFVNQMAIAVENARLFDMENIFIAQLISLSDITSTIMTSRNLNEVLSLIAESVQKIFGSDASAKINLYNQKKKEFLESVECGPMANLLRKHRPRTDGINVQTIETEKMLCIEDEKSEHYHLISEGAKKAGVKSLACLPLQIGTVIVGTLYIHFQSRHYLNANEKKVLNLFANLAAIAIQNAHLYQDLQQKRIAAEKIARIGDLAGTLLHDVASDRIKPIELNIDFITENCKRELENKYLADKLDIINKCARDARHLVHRLYAESETFETEEFYLLDIIKEAIESVDIPQNIYLKESYPMQLPKVFATKQLLEVFRNLLRNSFYAMPNGGIVEIGTKLSEFEIEIWVEDTGCGMSEEEKEQIFNLGYGKRGGFGLWWSRNYLLRLDGRIEVESK
jgi:GAF domain-containing protein